MGNEVLIMNQSAMKEVGELCDRWEKIVTGYSDEISEDSFLGGTIEATVTTLRQQAEEITRLNAVLDEVYLRCYGFHANDIDDAYFIDKLAEYTSVRNRGKDDE
jgi:hypothetical protein